jgi:hypothetical protein
VVLEQIDALLWLDVFGKYNYASRNLDMESVAMSSFAPCPAS